MGRKGKKDEGRGISPVEELLKELKGKEGKPLGFETGGRPVVLSVVMQKGGCGKTTLAENIGDQLSDMGYRVLYVDLDAQGLLTRIVGGKATIRTAYEVMLRTEDINNAIQHAERGDILPFSPLLSGIDAELASTIGREQRIREAIGKLPRGAYDFVIIDTPPALGIEQINALTASEGVILPVQAIDDMGLDMVKRMIVTIGEVRRYHNPDLHITGIVVTMWEDKSNVARYMHEVIESMAADAGIEILGDMRRYTAYGEVHVKGGSTSISRDYPGSRAAEDMKSITMNIIKETGKNRYMKETDREGIE